MPMFSEHLLPALAAPEQDGTIRLCFTIIHLKALVLYHFLLSPEPQVVKAALVLPEQSSSQMREELFQVV